MISTLNLSNLRPAQNRSRFTITKGNLDFSEFLAEVAVVLLRYFSNQLEWNVIKQLSFNEFVLSNNFPFEPLQY